MAKNYTRTYKVEGKGVNRLDASISYSLGGVNYFTYKDEPRGYWFSLQPWEKEGPWRKFAAFSGVKMCILPCSRQSAKRFEEAKGMLDALIDEHMAAFCAENALTLLGDGYEESER